MNHGQERPPFDKERGSRRCIRCSLQRQECFAESVERMGRGRRLLGSQTHNASETVDVVCEGVERPSGEREEKKKKRRTTKKASPLEKEVGRKRI